jgi:hypothetical protein
VRHRGYEEERRRRRRRSKRHREEVEEEEEEERGGEQREGDERRWTVGAGHLTISVECEKLKKRGVRLGTTGLGRNRRCSVCLRFPGH